MTARNPLVRVAGDALFCAWLEVVDGETGVWTRGFDLAGEPLGERTRVATAGPTTWTLNAVLPSDGRAWIVFDAVVGTTTEELFLVEVDQTVPSGPPDSIRLTEDDGFLSKYSNIDVDVGASHVALTWFDELDGNREVWCTSR